MGKNFRYSLREKKKKKKKISSLKIFFIFFITILLIFWGYNIWTTLKSIQTQELYLEEEIYQLKEEREVKRTLIVYEDAVDENLFILSIHLNTDTSEVLIYSFPSDLYIKEDYAGKYISIFNLTYAGESYTYDGKYSYVLSQISKSMAIDFDSYVWIKSGISRDFFDRGIEPLDIFPGFSSSRMVLRYRKADIVSNNLFSNMSFVETHNYFQQVRAIISTGRHKHIDLGKPQFQNEAVLGTGESVGVLDLVEIDKTIMENWGIIMSRDLAREHVKVEVYNASDIPMHARKVSRRINNSGCNVVRYNNIYKSYDRDYIYIPNAERFPESLSQILDIIDDPIIIYERPDFLTTGDIVVVLGDAYLNDLE